MDCCGYGSPLLFIILRFVIFWILFQNIATREAKIAADRYLSILNGEEFRPHSMPGESVRWCLYDQFSSCQNLLEIVTCCSIRALFPNYVCNASHRLLSGSSLEAMNMHFVQKEVGSSSFAFRHEMILYPSALWIVLTLALALPKLLGWEYRLQRQSVIFSLGDE